MKGKSSGILLLVSLACLLSFIATANAQEHDPVFQVSTIGAINGGVYDGAMTVGELAKHGDYGLGATHALGGELVVIQGQFYEFGADGRARRLAEDDTATFAAVTFFNPEVTIEVEGALSQQDVEALLLEHIVNRNVIHAVVVTGRFAHIRTRTPASQTKPYPPLAEVLKDQFEYDFYDVTGTMIGYWTPGYLSGIHAPGFHFHFIVDRGQASVEGAHGGHVLAYETAGATLSIDLKDRLEVVFPVSDPDFQGLEL